MNMIKSFWEEVRKNTAVISQWTLIIVLIFVFRSSFYEPFRIPSGSMIPTLLVGDFILVNKFAYGWKVPFTDWFGEPVYITKPSTPKRGDIIVFKYPVDPSINYIKRLIAIPGDRVQVIDKVVYLNGQPIAADAIADEELLRYLGPQNRQESPFGIHVYETTNGTVRHQIQMMATPQDAANTDEYTVPEEHYFVMGDNRDNSQDSRKWGFVPFSHIKGKAFLVWFNFNPAIFNDERFDYPWMFYPSRIGKLVQ